MFLKLFDPEIPPACGYCAHGTLSVDGKNILCPKKGVTDPSYSCRRFSYDPLKRVPREPVRQEFTQEDFTL